MYKNTNTVQPPYSMDHNTMNADITQQLQGLTLEVTNCYSLPC